MSGFWRTWLNGACWAAALFGVLLMGGAFAATEGPVRMFYEIQGGRALGEFDPVLRYATALMGAVTLGWSLTLMAAFRAAHELGARARGVWWALTAAIEVWFVVDSALSVATGFALNVASNALFVALFLIPILRCGVLRAPQTGLGAAAPAR